MKCWRLLVSVLGMVLPATASSKDPRLTDESFIRQQFDLSTAKSRDMLQIREANKQKFQLRSRFSEGDYCLAYAIETGECSIPIDEFNRLLVSYFPDSLETFSDEAISLKARKARLTVLEDLIDRAFLSSYWPNDSIPNSKAKPLEIWTKKNSFPISPFQRYGCKS
jgi:hypothetical protein